MSWAGGFNKSWTPSQLPSLDAYLHTLKFNAWRPKFIVLHHTGIPTLVQWKQTDELQRIKNLEHFYRDIQGWSSGPHFFVSPTRIFEGTPCNVPGTHSSSWNHLSLGVEMAGDYEIEPFDKGVRDNTVKLLAILHRMFGLDPGNYKSGIRGLHFHKEDTGTTHKICPGKNVNKQELVRNIASEMLNKSDDHQTDDQTTRSLFVQILGHQVLRTGSSDHSLVKILQIVLTEYGYPIKVDGYFGPATDSAVRDFQKKAHLTVDGEVGVATAHALLEGMVSGHPDEVPLPNIPGVIPPAPKIVDPEPMWLIEARKWIGTHEAPGGADNPKILEMAQEVGGDIAKTYTHDSIPWCSLFVSFVLAKVGLPSPNTLWALNFLTDKSLITLPGPAVGAFVPMKREGGGGHIAILVGRDLHENLMCLGGNVQDTVCISPVNKERALAFRWPKGVSVPSKIGFNSLPIVTSDGKISTVEAS